MHVPQTNACNQTLLGTTIQTDTRIRNDEPDFLPVARRLYGHASPSRLARDTVSDGILDQRLQNEGRDPGLTHFVGDQKVHA